MTKSGIAVALVLAMILGFVGVTGNFLRPASGDETAAKAAEEKKVANDLTLKTLLQAKLAVAQELAAEAARAYHDGQIPFTELLEANRAVSEAELELCNTNGERVAVLERMLKQAKDYEMVVAQKVKVGASPKSVGFKARLNCLEFEIALERVKQK